MVGQGFVIAFIFCYTIIYYLCFNSVSWTYGAEVLPMHIRSKGNACKHCNVFLLAYLTSGSNISQWLLFLISSLT